MKTTTISAALVFLTALASGCETLPRLPTETDYSDKAEMEAVKQLAVTQLGLKLDKIQRQGSEQNFVAVKSDNLLVSRRLDSRTYFVQDKQYGPAKEAGLFQGSDEELNKSCYQILGRLGIPEREVREAEVLHETIQVGSVDPKSQKVIREKPQPGRRLVRCSRHIEGVPIFSSNLTLGLTKQKTIGFMEVHWPVVPEATIKEAGRLQYKLKHGWRPPEQEGARVESIEAGVIHSAATGFLMDIYPAIRVVYAPEKEEIGRKLVLHFDRHGHPVPIPREFDVPCQVQEKRGDKK